jgi:uncharacterized protein (UPF0332 family)
MIYKVTVEDLLKEGRIKKCSVDEKAALNLMRRATKDISTARRNLSEDEDCVYSYAYNAMLRSGLALMFWEGFRPEVKDMHLTVVRFVTSFLGKEFRRVLNDYDFMRRKRHLLVYEPDIPCSKKEAAEAIKTAEEFIGVIFKIIKRKNPQLELGS